jgi:epsilon-lactone hydrolase
MSLRAELVRIGVRAFLKRRSRHFDVAAWRTSMTSIEGLVPRPPARSQTTEVKAGRLTFYRTTTNASQPARNVLYLHGGGYMSGAPAHYRHFTWRLADTLKASIWALEYRLAPEHPYPAALEDALAGFIWLTGQGADAGRSLVMGDSAGGGLALGLLLKLRDEGRPLPRAAVALSPWTDLALTGASLASNAAADPMLNVEHFPEIAALYLAGADPRTPYASPLYGDVAGLPPVLIQVGSDEVLRDDALRMADKLARANPLSRIEVWPRMPHVWQLFVPVLPEAHQAIARIGDFITQVEAA